MSSQDKITAQTGFMLGNLCVMQTVLLGTLSLHDELMSIMCLDVKDKPKVHQQNEVNTSEPCTED